MRWPLVPGSSSHTKHRPSAGKAARIILMESISERERPVRQRKKQVTALRRIVRVAIWIAVLLTTFGVLTWRMIVR